jgi:hypothetical protein
MPASAADRGTSRIVCGPLGSSYNDAAQSAGGLALSTARLNQIIMPVAPSEPAVTDVELR